MASRFLKATGLWESDLTWSATDGGAAGATFPIAGDNVFITANGNGLTVTPVLAAACDSIVCSGASTATITGTQTITVGGNVTLLSTMTIPNTITFTITGTGNFAGSTLATLGNINLNGTAHTISGSFTCNILTRNGTATKTDSVTFTSGTTVTCTTCAMIGNSATNRLLVQSSTLGSPAIITATNWTGTNAADFMDITSTNAVDLSAAAAYTGDCGGNAGITFTAAAPQASTGAGNWSGAVWTSRVPLPQDDVTCSHNMTIDMPRIGRSITFTGTPTVSLSNAVTNYGSWTNVVGMTYTPNNKNNLFYGRSSYSIVSGGKIFYQLYFRGMSGTYTITDDTVVTKFLYHDRGTLNLAANTTVWGQTPSMLIVGTNLNLGNGTLTLTGTDPMTKMEVVSGQGFNPGTSTIVLTNSGVSGQQLTGAGFTFNNVTVQGAGAYTLTITGNNTFNTFTIDRSAAAKTVVFTGTTQTVTHLSIPISGTTAATITGGTFTTGNDRTVSDYLVIQNSTVTPNGRWFAKTHSTNTGTNTGWSFRNPPGRDKGDDWLVAYLMYQHNHKEVNV
jgi:hypothetical protein